MPVNGPIEQLEALDAIVQQSFAAQPTLTSILTLRLRAQFPRWPDNLLPGQVWLGEHDLTHWIEQRWTTRLTPSERQSCYYVHEGRRHDLAALYAPLLVRFITLFCDQALTLYLDHLKRFWLARRPSTADQPLHAWLGVQRRAQWLAQLTLREQDGTLPDVATALAHTLLNHADHGQRQTLAAYQRPGVYTASLYQDDHIATFPGCFIITERDARGGYDASGAFTAPAADPFAVIDEQADAGSAVLYTLAFGLEAFDSLAALHLELAERLDDTRQAQALLAAFAPSDRDKLHSPDRLSFTEMHTELFSAGVEQLRQRQQRAVTDAWHAAWRKEQRRDIATLQASLAEAASVIPLINRQAGLRTRYGALLHRYMPQWMKNASATDQVLIYQSMQALALATAQAAAPGLPSLRSFAERRSLLAYANQQLASRLARQLGRQVDPDQVFITTRVPYQVGPLTPPTNPESSIPGRARPQAGETLQWVVVRRSLTELALENVERFDLSYLLTAHVSTADGAPIADLGAGAVQALVREVNIGDDYARHITHRLVTSPEGQSRRERHYQLSLAALRASALKAHIAGHLAADRQARGYQWLSTVLEHPAHIGRPTVLGHRIDVHNLLLAGTLVTGLLVVSPDVATAIPNVLLYTPDAPDSRVWREYSTRAAMLEDLATKPGLLAYVLGRVNLGGRDAVRRLLLSGHPGAMTQLRVIRGDFIAQGYLDEVDHVLSDSDALSTTTEESDRQARWNASLTVLEIITLILPSKVRIPLAVGRALLSLWNAVQSLKVDERIEGLRHLLTMLTYISDAAAGLVSGSFFTRTYRHLPLKPPSPINPNLAVGQEVTPLRYRIDGIYEEGVYEQRSADGGPSRYYIEDKAGRRYQVDFDGGRWLVVDARNPEAFYKSLVRRNAQGEWELPQDVRWDGLMPDLQAVARAASVEAITPPLAAPDAQGIIHHAGKVYLRLGEYLFCVKRSLREHRYVLRIPAQRQQLLNATLLLRRNLADDGWEIKVRQAGVVSHWLAFAP